MGAAGARNTGRYGADAVSAALRRAFRQAFPSQPVGGFAWLMFLNRLQRDLPLIEKVEAEAANGDSEAVSVQTVRNARQTVRDELEALWQ